MKTKPELLILTAIGFLSTDANDTMNQLTNTVQSSYHFRFNNLTNFRLVTFQDNTDKPANAPKPSIKNRICLSFST